MTTSSIEIWATGELSHGATTESVATHIQRLFPSASAEQRARFIAGTAFRIMTVSDPAAAERVVNALAAAGINVNQRPSVPTPSVSASAPKTVAPTAPSATAKPTMPSPAAATRIQSHPSSVSTTNNPISNAKAPISAGVVSNERQAEAEHPYEEITDEAPPPPPFLSRLIDFTWNGAATLGQSLAVVGTGLVLSNVFKSGWLQVLASMILLLGICMVLRRRPSLPDGFQAELDRIGKETGDSQFLGSTKKEMHHLPSILSSNEHLIAFTSGYMSGNTWLIALTDRRIIFLDKGWLYGLKQVTIDLDKVNAVSGSTGLIFGDVLIEDNASQRKIKNVPRGSVIKFTNKVRDAIEIRKHATTGGAPKANDASTQLSQLASLHEKGLITLDEFNLQKARILAG